MSASLEGLHRAAVGVTLRMCAADAGVNPDALLDSRGFLAATDGLDPAAPAFPSAVRSAALAAAEADPGRFRVPARQETQAPPLTVADVTRMAPAEVLAAGEAGKLRHLGYGPRRPR
jgi:hypothetical protein